MTDQGSGGGLGGISRIVPMWLAVVLLILGLGTIGASFSGFPTYTATLPTDAMEMNGGYAYQVKVPAPTGWQSMFTLPEDSGAANASKLQVFENGQPLGPAHTAHTDVRGVGKGRYSHWAGFVYLSASDNTDARSNGRAYTVQSALGWPLWSLIVAGLLALIGVVGIAGGLSRK